MEKGHELCVTTEDCDIVLEDVTGKPARYTYDKVGGVFVVFVKLKKSIIIKGKEKMRGFAASMTIQTGFWREC